MRNRPCTDRAQQSLATGSNKPRLFRCHRNTNDRRAKINWSKQEKGQKQKKKGAIFYNMLTKCYSLKVGKVLKNAVCRVNVVAIYSKTTSSKNKLGATHYYCVSSQFMRKQNIANVSRRVARIWKRGGYFERVRKVQTTLTRNFTALESVCPKIQTKFLGKLGNSKVFSAQNQVVSKKKKKKIFTEIETDFSVRFGNSNV